MPFRARTVGQDGGFGAPLTVAGLKLTGDNQLFMGELDEDLGFGVPPDELLKRDDCAVELLGGEPYPDSSGFRHSTAEYRLDHMRAVEAGEWPSERELSLQANITAKLDPETADDAMLQYLERAGYAKADAQKELERRRRKGKGGVQLLDGVSPIKPRGQRTAKRGRKVASEKSDEGGSGGEDSKALTAAEAQAARELAAAEKAAKASTPTPAPKPAAPKKAAKAGGAKGGGRGR